MQRNIRVILKTVRPMDSDYRIRSIIDMSLDLYRWDMFVTTNNIDRMLIQNTDPTEHITVNPDRGYGQSIRIRHLVLVSQ